jgi:hypothetical protein
MHGSHIHHHGAVGNFSLHAGGHTIHMGILFPVNTEMRPLLFPGEPPIGAISGWVMAGLMAGEIGLAAGAHGFTHILVPHAAVPSDQGTIIAPPAAGTGDIDQTGAAAQPDVSAMPSAARPPGAAGPGRPVSGWSGPGRLARTVQ